MSSVADLLNLGRSAMMQGRPDQAITILTSACIKQSSQPAPDPRPWFHLAASHAMENQHDAACILFLKARIEAQCYLSNPKTPSSALVTVSQIESASRQNQWQSLEKTGGTYKSMLPALNDEGGYVKPWREALQAFAKQLITQKASESNEGRSEAQVTVKGGIGWQALLLAQILSSGEEGYFPVSLHVADRLAEAIASTLQLSSRNPLSSVIEIKRISSDQGKVSDQVCDLSVASWHRSLGLEGGVRKPGAQEKEQASIPKQCNVIFPDLCTPNLSLVQLSLELSKALKGAANQSSALFSPSKITVWGTLVESRDLITMNEVVTADMMEDTGLEYGLANEFLWRPNRPVQVDRFPHVHLSEPFQLLTVDAKDLISADRRKVLNQKKSIEVTLSKGGSLDCLLCWIDYQLCEDVHLSYAPNSIKLKEGLRGEHPCLTMHSSQRAFYFPIKPHLRAGQTISVDLSLENDSLRLEIDEDSLLSKTDKVLDHLLPAGDPIAQEEEEQEKEKAKNPSETKKDANGAKNNQIQIPAYHMSMLNDRDRTIKYRDAINEAISKLSSPSDLVLDIGTGTGLLSMIAAKAGATNILAFEREPSLAMAASSLISANGLSDSIEVVNRNCQEISLGEGKAAIVLHEIFGSDPLSEQILPTMRFVRDNMTLPSTRFVPAEFKSIAALAWSGGKINQIHCKTPSTDLMGLNLKCMEEFTPWKVETNLVDVSGLLLLSEPCEALHFNLEQQPLPLEGSEQVKVQLCAPTSPQEFIARGGHCIPFDPTNSNRTETADCIVSWFAANMGHGGWLTTAPGQTTRHGHWVQTIQFIEPMKLDKKVWKMGSISIAGSYQKDRCTFSLVI